MKMRDALYHAVHDYPGGVELLAQRIGIASSTLQNLANPRLDSHEWTLKRIKQVIDFTGDQRVAQAFCAEFGGIFVPMGTALAAGNADVFRHLSKLAKEFGDVPAEIERAMADGSISINDRERIRQQVYELHQAAFAFEQYVDSLVDGPKPTLTVASSRD